MKRAVIVLSVLMPWPAMAADSILNDLPKPGRPYGPWYAAVSAGALVPMDSTGTVSGAEATLSADTGYSLSIAAGYKWPKNIRTELEFSYGTAELNQLEYQNVKYKVGGTINLIAIAVNAFYDFKNTSDFTPYVGGGIGIVHSLLTNTTSTTGTRLDDSYSTNPKFQGELGVSYDAGRGISVGPSYRIEHVIDGGRNIDNSTYHLFKMNLSVPFRSFL